MRQADVMLDLQAEAVASLSVGTRREVLRQPPERRLVVAWAGQETRRARRKMARIIALTGSFDRFTLAVLQGEETSKISMILFKKRVTLVNTGKHLPSPKAANWRTAGNVLCKR